MCYKYQYNNVPNLDIIESNILISSFVDIYNFLQWDEDDLGQELKIHLNRELSVEEKVSLDSLIV